MDYLQSRLEGQEKWEATLNERDLIRILKSIKSLSHKYSKDTEYYHVAYHTLLCRFMLFQYGDYSNLEYKQQFKEQIELLEVYNRGVLFRNSPGATTRKIAILGLNVETEGDVEKAQVSARGEYLATAFLISLDRSKFGELILSLKNDYTKQQKNYPKPLTDMYVLLVVFKPTRVTPVSRGHSNGLNFGNLVVKYKTTGDRDHGSGGGIIRKLECWQYGE